MNLPIMAFPTGTEPNQITISSDKVEMIIDYINSNYKSNLNLKGIAEKFNYSPYHFSRIFNNIFHISLPDYISYVRLDSTINEFISEDISITDAAFNNGFQSMQTFYRAYHKYFGDKPIHSFKKNV